MCKNKESRSVSIESRHNTSIANAKLNIACVLLSGGLDSVTAVYYALEQGFSVEAIFLDYDYAARDRELDCAMDIADILRLRLHTLRIPFAPRDIRSLADRSSPLLENAGNQSDMVLFQGLVIWLAASATYALTSQIRTIIMGTNKDDVKMHPGLQSGFFEAFETLVRLWTGTHMRMLSPFINLSKSDIVRVAIELGVPLERTWSCEAGGKTHCGECAHCLARSKSFMDLSLKDPTEYETNPVLVLSPDAGRSTEISESY